MIGVQGDGGFVVIPREQFLNVLENVCANFAVIVVAKFRITVTVHLNFDNLTLARAAVRWRRAVVAIGHRAAPHLQWSPSLA